MLVEVKKLTGLRFSHMTHFDLHEDFGLACLVEDNDEVTLYFNDLKCRTWTTEEHPNSWGIKWFDANHVVLHLAAPNIEIVSAQTWRQHVVGYGSHLYLSPNYMIAIYSEDAHYSSRPGEFACHLISVFLRDGAFEFGVRDLMDKDRDSWKLEEVTAAYTFNDNFSFVAWDSQFLWILYISERSWKKVPFEFSMGGIEVLSGDEKAAYAIYDNRRLIQSHPELPPFELAIFDLVSETSSKHEFAPVEAALTAAGFEMSEIKFQPNATGRIIVSDSKKAALLEFSGLP